MCFLTKNRFFRISFRRKICYKVMDYNEWKGMLNSVYYPSKNGYHIGEVIKASSEKFFHYLTSKRLFKKSNLLEGEVVHAFKERPSCYVSPIEKIVECEIPPFTPYWENDDHNEIAAFRMKIVKLVE